MQRAHVQPIGAYDPRHFAILNQWSVSVKQIAQHIHIRSEQRGPQEREIWGLGCDGWS